MTRPHASPRNLVLAASAVLLTLALPLSAQPARGGHRGGPHPAAGGGGPVAMLGLSATQEEAWHEGMEAIREAQQPELDELAALHEELQKTLAADSPNPTILGELTLELRERRQTVHAAHETAVDALAEAILDTEQKALWAQMKSRRAAMKERMEAHGERRPGPPHHRGPGFHGGPPPAR